MMSIEKDDFLYVVNQLVYNAKKVGQLRQDNVIT
jgi:hypothetical protein